MDSTFLNDVLTGLSNEQKRLPSKHFYDAAGSRLFDEITELDEYYLTRTELAIMRRHIDAIGAALGGSLVLVEYGSGSSTKTRLLLEHIPAGSTYIPIDISGTHLREVATRLAEEYPHIRVLPVQADYSTPVELPAATGRRVVYFPGSTIGNFEPSQATRFLARLRVGVGADGGALIGVDLKKDLGVLLPAYNDAAGVTARFNLNLLMRINRELNADFDVSAFSHRAIFNESEGRIEMHLVSERNQQVQVHGNTFRFVRGEHIHTENSYKYGLDQFEVVVSAAGFRVERVWTDERDWFAVFLLHATESLIE